MKRIPSLLRRSVWAALFLLAGLTAAAQSRYLYVIEDLRTGQVVRSGEVGEQGFLPDTLILGPEGRFRAWFLRTSDLYVGNVEFRTGTAGQTLGQSLF